jgi:hypothetical protein
LRTSRDHQRAPRKSDCPRCEGRDLDKPAFAQLVGFYLGDGCLSKAQRYYSFRVSCDAAYPAIVATVGDLMRTVRPGIRVFEVKAPGAVVVQSHWQHWPCLFPQHGPGRKHERPIHLTQWQQDIADEHTADLLRGRPLPLRWLPDEQLDNRRRCRTEEALRLPEVGVRQQQQ